MVVGKTGHSQILFMTQQENGKFISFDKSPSLTITSKNCEEILIFVCDWCKKSWAWQALSRFPRMGCLMTNIIYRASFFLSLGEVFPIVSLSATFSILVSELAHLTSALVDLTTFICCVLKLYVQRIRSRRSRSFTIEAVTVRGIHLSLTVLIFTKK